MFAGKQQGWQNLIPAPGKGPIKIDRRCSLAVQSCRSRVLGCRAILRRCDHVHPRLRPIALARSAGVAPTMCCPKVLVQPDASHPEPGARGDLRLLLSRLDLASNNTISYSSISNSMNCSSCQQSIKGTRSVVRSSFSFIRSNTASRLLLARSLSIGYTFVI
jgi:hypothetical protein